jgi:beta-glucosidase/6-phospho-beta-glucosidase/beta-galactosidase
MNELRLYVKYLVNENNNISNQFNQKKEDYINKFKANLLIGINYYNELAEKMEGQANELFKGMQNELEQIEISLLALKTATVTV